MRDKRSSATVFSRARAPLLFLVACAFAALPGCAFRSGPADNRADAIMEAQFPADNWPPRETGLLDDMVQATPAALTLAFPMTVVADGKLVTANWMQKVAVSKTGVYGRGIVRQFAPIIADDTSEKDAAFEREEFGGLQFVSFPPDPDAVRVASSATSDSGSESRYRRFLLRRLGIRPGRGDDRRDTWYLMRQGTHMRIFEPSSAAGAEPRGVMLHLSSLAGFEYEKPVIQELCNAGWLVLQVDPSTARRQESPVRADAATDLQEPAKRLARIIDNRIAEVAYAAEAGLDFLQGTRPELDGLPVVLVGYSAGALVGPSVATLLHDRLDAIVLVGGGANLLNISRRSSLTNGGISVKWANADNHSDDPSKPEISEAAWRRLEDAYLSNSHLDPYVTAPFLVDKPVLLLHGMFDDIIPADTGDVLYERLGKPERVAYTLGHRGLFWRLPTQAGLIARWLDRQIPAITPSPSDHHPQVSRGVPAP
jgi:pimeloyl-ACP methyl ester carboxylesterase